MTDKFISSTTEKCNEIKNRAKDLLESAGTEVSNFVQQIMSNLSNIFAEFNKNLVKIG